MERGEGERGDGERWLESAAAPVQFDYNICRRKYYENFHATYKMASKKKISVIEDIAFSGTDSLSANDLKRLVVPDFKSAPATLIEDYENTPLFFIGMDLSEDNTRIENATPVTTGLLRGASVNASKIWSFGQHEVQLNFQPIDLSIFKVFLYC